MICKNCNKEFEDINAVCPFCGEKCGESDDFFHEMLSHVMEENTQSTEEMAKLKADMRKRRKNRKRNRIIALISVALAVILCVGVFAAVSVLKEKYADHGSATYHGGFDGTVFSVYDENGNEIRTITGGIYAETMYNSSNKPVNNTIYTGFVSFEKTDYENDIAKTVYNFDGTASYTYKDFVYTTNDNGMPSRASYSSKSGEVSGVYDYAYDENGNKTAQYVYEFVSRKEHVNEYDSIGRKTGEQEYSLNGSLIYDKQYSYKPDGSLYLSSINEVYKTDATGAAQSYKLTSFGEDGKATGTVINSPEGDLLGNIEYAYDDTGKLSSAKYYDITSTQTGWELYEYYDNGDLKKYAKKDNGVESAEWYTYTYHDNGTKASVSVAPSENSQEYISYTSYDASGKLVKSITPTENTIREYNALGQLSKLNTYSSQNQLIKQTIYTYNPDGNCSAQTDTLPDGSVIEERTYAYDGLGNVINQAGGDADHLYINEYDETNSLTAVSTYRLVSSELFEYNKDGFVIKHTKDGITYGFDRLKNGRISSKYTYGADGSILAHAEYKYNKLGDQTGLVSYNADGTVYGKTEISYDDRMKIISLETRDNNDDVIYSVSYNYSVDNPSASIRGTNRIGGKTDKYEYKYTFDENGFISKVIYSKNGKTATEYEYTHNEIGDPVSGLIRQLLPQKSETSYTYSYDGNTLSCVTSKLADGTENKIAYELDSNNRPYQKTGDIK